MIKDYSDLNDVHWYYLRIWYTENFKKLGYSQDLKHFPKDGEDDDIMQVRSTKE